jgi:hypothetical protein
MVNLSIGDLAVRMLMRVFSAAGIKQFELTNATGIPGSEAHVHAIREGILQKLRCEHACGSKKREWLSRRVHAEDTHIEEMVWRIACKSQANHGCICGGAENLKYLI